MSKERKKEVFNSLNADTRPKNYRQINEPSMTVPDQTLTIRQLLERHARGLTLGGQAGEPIYDEEAYGVHPKTLDLVDIQKMKEDAENKINRHKTGENLARKKKQEDEEKKRIEDAAAELVRQKEAEQK